MMLDELQRLNYAHDTIRSYVHTVEEFSRRFNCRPDRLGPRHVREYQVELFQKRKLSPGSVAVRLAALRFFYCKTLKRAWNISDTLSPQGSVTGSLSRQVRRGSAAGLSGWPAQLRRKSQTSRATQDLHCLAAAPLSTGLGGLPEASLRWSRLRLAISWPLHPSRGHL